MDKNMLKESVKKVELIHSEDIPDLDLYMDQILTLINKNEQLITKTMINNYSKAKVITPVKGKKYSKEQVLQIIMINELKNNLSIKAIKEVINKIAIEDTEKIYNEVIEMNEEDQENEERLINSLLELDSEEKKLTSLLRLNHLANLVKSYMEMIRELD